MTARVDVRQCKQLGHVQAACSAQGHIRFRMISWLFKGHIDRSSFLFPPALFHDGLEGIHSVKITLPSLALNLLAEHRVKFLLRLFRKFGRARTIALCLASF